MAELKAGDLIGVDGSRGFNHGCQDWAVLKYLGEGKAEVTSAGNCTSCWQVGHDQNHVFATVGDVWDIDSARVAPTEEHWSTQVSFEYI